MEFFIAGMITIGLTFWNIKLLADIIELELKVECLRMDVERILRKS